MMSNALEKLSSLSQNLNSGGKGKHLLLIIMYIFKCKSFYKNNPHQYNASYLLGITYTYYHSRISFYLLLFRAKTYCFLAAGIIGKKNTFTSNLMSIEPGDQ